MTIIKKFEPEQHKQAISIKYIGLIAGSLLVLTIIEVWVSNNVAIYGEKMDNLSAVAKTLSLENQILQNDIAESGALNNLASESAKLGFSEPESIQYIR